MHNNEVTHEAEAILKRITDEMQKLGRSHASLIKYLDLPKGTYGAWNSGRSRNFCEHLGAIAEFLGVDAEYLLTGKIAEKTVISDSEQELLDLYRKLSPEKQKAVLQNIKWLV